MPSASPATKSSSSSQPVIKRSDDAIKRRAEKRGRTFEEQFKVDVKKQKRDAKPTNNQNKSDDHSTDKPDKKPYKKPKTELKPKPSTPSPLQSPPLSQGGGKWICTECSNENFAQRAECNRCGLAKTPVSFDSQPERPSKYLSKPKRLSRPPSSLKIPTFKPTAPVNGWSIAQPSSEQLEENRLLRELAMLSEADSELPEWAELQQEERERALLLLERTKRKANKRAKLSVKRVRGGGR